ALMDIDGIGWDWSYMANEEDHALVANGETPTEFTLMANIENKVKEGVGYNAVPLPATDLYLSPKKDLLWTGLPEFVDDTVTDYSRPSPTISSTHRSAGHRPNGAHMRPPQRSSGPRPHRDSMRPSFRPAGHRPRGPSMNPWRPTMNGARPYKSFFQAPSY
nr:hypothetical protein [Tanacetum cinerariifolium]